MKTRVILALSLLWVTGWVKAQPPGLLLSHNMPGRSFQGPLPQLSANQKALSARLHSQVSHLASHLGERNSRHYATLVKTRDWIRGQLTASGYTVREQNYRLKGQSYSNLVCELSGQSKQVVVVGAHYDSALDCPAANDNGSGVAALLELARSCQQRGQKPKKTLRLVAFVNEEPPYFAHDSMGSHVYAQFCKKRGDKISAMLSLETLGYYSDAPNSQKYPPLLSMSYPTTGNFVGFIGNLESGPLVQRCVGLFRKRASFPSQGAALSAGLPGVGWSDHRSFWEIGVPAIMVTDTAPFRYPHYHLKSDTPDKIDFDRLARVVEGLQKVVWGLANDEK